MRTLFGTDGIRGVAGAYPLDDDTVSRTLNGWIRLVVPAEEGS